jgi:hypothetical protein
VEWAVWAVWTSKSDASTNLTKKARQQRRAFLTASNDVEGEALATLVVSVCILDDAGLWLGRSRYLPATASSRPMKWGIRLRHRHCSDVRSAIRVKPCCEALAKGNQAKDPHNERMAGHQHRT